MSLSTVRIFFCAAFQRLPLSYLGLTAQKKFLAIYSNARVSPSTLGLWSAEAILIHTKQGHSEEERLLRGGRTTPYKKRSTDLFCNNWFLAGLFDFPKAFPITGGECDWGGEKKMPRAERTERDIRISTVPYFYTIASATSSISSSEVRSRNASCSSLSLKLAVPSFALASNLHTYY